MRRGLFTDILMFDGLETTPSWNQMSDNQVHYQPFSENSSIFSENSVISRFNLFRLSNLWSSLLNVISRTCDTKLASYVET